MKPKILLLDIETAPAKAYIWSLWDRFVPLERLVEPGYTLCWVAKWYGKKRTEFRSVHHDGMATMVERIWDLLNEADAVVHYNGKKFDIPTLNREFLVNDYGPPSPYWQIDLLEVCKRQFRFQSNKLDFVTQQLGLDGKVAHKGMELWKECMIGKASAWRQMKEYNIQDVLLLEDLYEYLLPWIKSHPNVALWEASEEPMCPNCGGRVSLQGFRTTKVSIYRRYKCNWCGKWSRGRKRAIATPDGVLVG